MATSGLTEFHLWSKGGWPRVEVAGEFHHQDAIRSLLPRNPSEGAVEIESVAHLVPEPHNRFDGNAVRAHVSVVLDSPHLVHPLNVEPTKPHRVLPHGSALQVRGQEKHLDALTPWVAQHGEGWVYGELRAMDVKGVTTTKEVVEILIDGDVIGELTPAMSAHYVPAIQHCSSRGRAVVAKVFLKGNALKVEAVLHAAKAHELDAGWMADPLAATARTEPAPQPDSASAGRTPAPMATTVGADFELPPKPARIVFNPAPGWPPPPPGVGTSARLEVPSRLAGTAR